MPFPAETWVNQIEDPAVRAEFQSLYSLLQGYLSREHKDSGAHAAVTADSVTTRDASSHGVRMDSTGLLVTPSIAPYSVRLSDSGSFGLGGTDTAAARNLYLTSSYTGAVGPNASVFVSAATTNGPTQTLTIVSTSAGAGAARFDVNSLIVEDSGASTKQITLDGINGTITERGRTTPMGEWAAFPSGPTWTNLSVGDGTVTARYMRIGKTTFFRIYLLFGATTSISGTVSFTIPTTTTAAIASAGSFGASVDYRDSSAATVYSGEARVASTTTMSLFDDSTPTAAISSTAPFTWATGDSISIVGSYEEA